MAARGRTAVSGCRTPGLLRGRLRAAEATSPGRKRRSLGSMCGGRAAVALPGRRARQHGRDPVARPEGGSEHRFRDTRHGVSSGARTPAEAPRSPPPGRTDGRPPARSSPPGLMHFRCRAAPAQRRPPMEKPCRSGVPLRSPAGPGLSPNSPAPPHRVDRGLDSARAMTAVLDPLVEGQNAEDEVPAEVEDAEAEAFAEVEIAEVDAPDQVQDEEAEPTPQFNLLRRLGALPAVATLWDAAARSYGHAKNRSQVVATTLHLVECTAEIAVVRGKPVAEKFSRQLSYVDGLACRGLDKVQEAYPDIAEKQPREIVGDALQFGRRKCADAKNYGVLKACAERQDCLCWNSSRRRSPRANHVIGCSHQNSAELHMTRRGIPPPGEPSAHVTEAIAVLQRLETVAQKAEACARVHLYAQAAATYRSANEALARLDYFVTGPLDSPEALTLRQVFRFLDKKIRTFLIDPPLTVAYFFFLYADRCCSRFLTNLFPVLEAREQEAAAIRRDRAGPSNGALYCMYIEAANRAANRR
ncbi:hypothetical protein IscW_ISCW001727 [Ixodes scapularis]|uniref:Uncharacterized protein n=1 Tax=Ixodes scapularis TaxID=6945 RepID=B7P5K5_IXOSC|nr:hypothetical protein IscW_ISCW001727 [Ixodes scapularis]|eukprot:XP_002407581.1 hypothetical protein IscW_ISCW001727 [Ixodes scapularis]